MISEQVKELREGSCAYKAACFPEAARLMEKAADTIEALSSKLEKANRKQFPQKPIEREVKNINGRVIYMSYYCPNCEAGNIWEENDSGFDKNYDYCPDCGQAIDWSK